MKLLALLSLATPFIVSAQKISLQASSSPNQSRTLLPTANLQCGEGKVANSQKICIEPNYIEGCSLYQTENTCQECAEGYRLSKGKCDYSQGFRGQDSRIVGCLQQNRNNSCDNCANGFRRMNGKCEKGVNNCLVYSEDNSCKECKEEYSLVMNECKLNLLLGCRVAALGHTCKECFSPFKLNEGICDIDHCKILNDYGCTHCECGFYLDTDRKCEKMGDGCLRYNRGKCTDCLAHYKLKGGNCDIEGCLQYEGNSCKVCDKKYDKVGNGCNFKNCYDWLDDQCLICNSGFHLKSGICVNGSDEVTLCK